MTDTGDYDVEGYESHEAWLARQQEILDLIDVTLAGLHANPEPDPQPRALGALPWWRDEHRLSGEAANLGDAVRNLRTLLLAMFVRFLRSRFAPLAALVMLVWALFTCGAMLWSVTASLL
jgi:hypothetical protein